MNHKKHRRIWITPERRIGLLFTPRLQTYEERMWQLAHDAAIKDGKSEEDARCIADDAAIEAKGVRAE